MELSCPICKTRMVLDAKGTTIYCPACAEKKVPLVTEQLVSPFPEQPAPPPFQPPGHSVHTIRWSYSLNLGGEPGSRSFLQKVIGAVVGTGLLVLAVGVVLALMSGMACLFAGALALFSGLVIVNIFKNSFRKTPREPDSVTVHPIPPQQLPPP